LDLFSDIVPGGAEAEHRPHALPHSRDCVLDLSAFMVVLGTPGDVAMESKTEVARGIMSADRLAAEPGDGDFAQHLCIARSDTGKIHDLAQSDDIGPAHRLRHVAGPKTCPGILKSRSTRHTARAFDPYVDRQAHCLVMHELDAGETEHIGD